MEGVKILEVAVASLIRVWVEASSFRYWSRSVMESVIPN